MIESSSPKMKATRDLADQLKRFRGIWTGFQGARVLLTANNLGIFEHLTKPTTSEHLSETLSLDKRATGILLDALAGLGVVKKVGLMYVNERPARLFLLKDSPYYQGDILRHADTMWHNWSELDSVVKTGLPVKKKRDWDAFIRGMHNLSVLRAEKVIGSLNLRGIKTAIDIGGGPGTYSIELAKRGIEVTLFDFDETLKIAEEIIQSNGITKGITYKAGDIINDALEGTYDLILISQLFHAYSGDDNKGILKKAVNAISPQGMIVIQEFFIEPNMMRPLESALFSVNMLVNTTGGRCYTPKEMKQWLLEAGLKKVRITRPVDTVVIIARR